MDRDQKQKEIREAIQAGQLTLQYLENARAELNSASNFGIADMLGIDLIGGIGKHIKMGKAQEQMNLAKRQVESFKKELLDLGNMINFDINMGGFLTFADFFLDGILADVFVQSKISEAKQQVDNGCYQVNNIIMDLYRMQSEL